MDEKQIVAKLIKESKHGTDGSRDIRFIDDEFIETAVLRYKRTKDEGIFAKIIDKYSKATFRKGWGKDFAPYLGNDEESGMALHDEIVWKTAVNFDLEKARKPKGMAFNANLVSALINQMKNLKNSRMTLKNHPQKICPICSESVYQIDEEHLLHLYDLDRYRATFHNYPLSSDDGRVTMPFAGKVRIDKVTMEAVNRWIGQYRIEDFWNEYPEIKPKGIVRCPVTNTEVKSFDDDYFEGIMPGYTRQEFVEDFPRFKGIITCPFTGEKVLGITQEWLNKVLKKDGTEPRYDEKEFGVEYPGFTMEARRVKVMNPYTGQMVDEITPVMLSQAGTTFAKHLERFGTIVIGKKYLRPVTCPFTGRKTRLIKEEDVEKVGKTIRQFYVATCKYPLQKFQVRCAIPGCGEWVDNIWDHLKEARHTYAPTTTMDDFRASFSESARKIVVSTNSYIENEDGESVHIGDLCSSSRVEDQSPIDIEDSLLSVAKDPLDVKIAKAMSKSQTMEDVYYLVAEKHDVEMEPTVNLDDTRSIKSFIAEKIKTIDFDILALPEEEGNGVKIMVPSKQTIKTRAIRLKHESDWE